MFTSKNSHFFINRNFDISSKENNINLSDKIKDATKIVENMANDIFNLAGGLEKKIFIRKEKEKKKKEKVVKKNLIEIFNENAERKRILGPYIKGQIKIDEQIKLIKNVLVRDEDFVLDFIKKRKNREEALEILNKNYLKNQQIKKKKENNKKDIPCIVSDELKELNLIKEALFLKKNDKLLNSNSEIADLINDDRIYNQPNFIRSLEKSPIKELGSIKLLNNIAWFGNKTFFSPNSKEEKKYFDKTNSININQFTVKKTLTEDFNNFDDVNKFIENEKSQNTFNDTKLNFNSETNFFNTEKKRLIVSDDNETRINKGNSTVKKTDNLLKLNLYNKSSIYDKAKDDNNNNEFTENFSNSKNEKESEIRKAEFPASKNINNPSDLNNQLSFLKINPINDNNFSLNKKKKFKLNLISNSGYEYPTNSENKININSNSNIFKNNASKIKKKNSISKANISDQFSNLNLFSNNNDENSNFKNAYKSYNSIGNKEIIFSSPKNNNEFVNKFNFTNNNSTWNLSTQNNPNNTNYANNENTTNTYSSNLNIDSNKSLFKNISKNNKNVSDYYSDNTSNSESAELKPKMINTASKITNGMTNYLNTQSKKKQIEKKIVYACTTTSNNALSLKTNIEKCAPIKNKVKNDLKKIEKKFLQSDTEKDLQPNKDIFRKTIGYFVYPNTFLDPVYVSNDDKNVIRESIYIDRLNEIKAFDARDVIYNRYGVCIDKNDLYNYDNDIKKEYNHKDHMNNYKSQKVRNDSFNIKKLIINSNVIKKDLIDLFKEHKISKMNPSDKKPIKYY